jgi:hypothetical protein
MRLQQIAVQCQREGDWKRDAIVHGKAEKHAEHLKLPEWLQCPRLEPHHAGLSIDGEHAYIH